MFLNDVFLSNPAASSFSVSVRLSVVSGSFLFSRKSCIPTKTSPAGMTVRGKDARMGSSYILFILVSSPRRRMASRRWRTASTVPSMYSGSAVFL